MSPEIFTHPGSELIGSLDIRGWVTLAALGSTGLIIDGKEWDAFVELVMVIDASVEFHRKSGRQVWKPWESRDE